MNIFSIDKNIPLLHEILKQNDNNIIHTFNSGIITNQNLIDTKTKFLIARSTLNINEKLLKNTNVKFIATATTGTDHIDINYLNKNNIPFLAAVGANSNSVAEYIIFSILFAFKDNFDNLLTKTIGIVGYGNIGSKVAYYLNKMNIKHIICDPFINNNDFYTIDSLIEMSDIITLHIPLTQNTSHPTFNIINKNRIEKIKNNSILINTSRGGICDENEMINHIGRIKYIIDTWHNEPNITNKQLIDVALISTPHIAGHSYNGKLNATLMICKKLNELYDMNLNYNLNIPETQTDIDFSDFKNMFKILSTSRNIIDTSNEMKKHCNVSNFANYFINARQNYPQYIETLNSIYSV